MPATHTADFQKHSRLTEVPVPEKAQHVASAGQNTSTRLQLIKLQAGHMALQLLLILGLFFIKAANTDSKIRCFVPSVMRGEQTNITCSFGDNIEIDDFVIQQYPQRGGFKEITFCYRDSGKLECQISEPGYQKHELDNGIFTLTVLNATEDDTGRYMCQVIPSVPDYTESCYFTLKEPTHTTPGVTAAGGAETTTQSNASQTYQTTSTENNEEDTDSQWGLIAALVVGVVVVVVVFLLVVVWLYFRKLLRARCRKGGERGECAETVSISNRGSGNVSTLDIVTHSQQKVQTEKDREQTQPLIPGNETFQPDLVSGETEKSTKSHQNSDQTQSNTAVPQTTSPQVHDIQSSSSPAKPVSQNPSGASNGTQIQNQGLKPHSGVSATDSAKDVISQTNATSLTSPSQRSAAIARSADSVASSPTNGSTAREDSSLVFSEQSAKHQAYDQAVKALQETGAVIIAGPERCGKTTLGQDLLKHLMKEGYSTVTTLRDPMTWNPNVRDFDKKCVFLFDEVFKAGDRIISLNTWSFCFRTLRERHCPLVIIVQTGERKEEDVQAFPFLRNIPVVFAVGEETKDSASKTMTEKEDQPRGEVWHTTVDPSGKVRRAARGVNTYKKGEKSEEHKLDFVIFNLQENIGRGPEADENSAKRLLKAAGVSDSDVREVTCITRLGEKKDWPPRPVIITVKTIETKLRIIDDARNSNVNVRIHPYTTEREIETQRTLFGRLG